MILRYLILCIFVLNTGCKLMPKEPDKQVAVRVDDSLAVTKKLLNAMQMVPGHDSVEYLSPVAKLLLAVIYTHRDTTAFIKQLAGDTTGFFAGYYGLEKLKHSDTTVMHFYHDLINLRNEFPALVSGNTVLLDRDKASICGYEKVLGKDTLLIVLNMSGDVQAFTGNFPYSQLTILLGNYDDGPLPPLNNSLALRPYEVRIYKLDR